MGARRQHGGQVLMAPESAGRAFFALARHAGAALEAQGLVEPDEVALYSAI